MQLLFMKNYHLLLIFAVLLLWSCTTKESYQTSKITLEFITPEQSSFFSTAYVEQTAYDTPSDGDLWPSAWSDDGHLYAANGDGKGFDLTSSMEDVVMNKIYGHPSEKNITGNRLAHQMGPIWSDTVAYNRKPTGMVSVDGVLYLAVQDLNKTKSPDIFNEVPAATIIRSDDKGRTWQWNKEQPMFSDHTFTTIIFLDFGQDGSNNKFDDYVYAYGLDNNWRDSFSDVVPDPVQLYLARIPKDALQASEKWEFYTGDLQGNAQWSAPGEITKRKPVLRDDRRRYVHTFDFKGIDSLSVISQGGIVYNLPLNRYIYTSWTEYTFEFYEAPFPWGPWKCFLSRDFGAYPWSSQNYGGYATVIPSKFISEDGMEMWLSSSTFAGKAKHYNFSLRRLIVTPFTGGEPENKRSAINLVASQDLKKVTPISAKSIRNGHLRQLNDGNKIAAIDSYSAEIKDKDYWGYTWSKPYNINKIIYTTGAIDPKNGGWFEEFKVQVRQDFKWITIDEIKTEPVYKYNKNVKPSTTYTLTFEPAWGDGVRIIGAPGGAKLYTSITELEVYFHR